MIDVYERLTEATSNLLLNARREAKNNKLKFVWIKNGNVLIKKTETTKTIRLRDIKYLEDIIKDENSPKLTNRA